VSFLVIVRRMVAKANDLSDNVHVFGLLVAAFAGNSVGGSALVVADAKIRVSGESMR